MVSPNRGGYFKDKNTVSFFWLVSLSHILSTEHLHDEHVLYFPYPSMIGLDLCCMLVQVRVTYMCIMQDHPRNCSTNQLNKALTQF